jgi:hypothetical protein
MKFFLIFGELIYIIPNKDKVIELLIDTTEFLFQYISTKWMDGFQIISINKDLIKTSIILY